MSNSDISNQDISEQDILNQGMPQRLYQEHPRNKSQYPGLKSKTESRESFHLDAIREWGRLRANGTIPNHIVQLNYLTVLSVKQIQALWRKHHRRLYEKGIVARAAIEITKDEWKQRPASRVHYHIVVKDHTRTHAELKEFFDAICRCEMEQSDFELHVFPFNEEEGGWRGYMKYFTKLNDKNNENIMFEKGLRLRKYYTIGQWWTDKDGNPITLAEIKELTRRYKVAKTHLRRSEKFIPILYQLTRDNTPANFIRLRKVLVERTDEVLLDLFNILQNQPTVFRSKPPPWIDNLQNHPTKRAAFLNAVYEKIKYSKNPDVIYALEIYHGYEPDRYDCKIDPDNTLFYLYRLEEIVAGMLEILDSIGKEFDERKCRLYLMQRVREWVHRKHTHLPFSMWLKKKKTLLPTFFLPPNLIGQIELMLDCLDGLGEDFDKQDYKQYIVDEVMRWVSERTAELSPPPE